MEEKKWKLYKHTTPNGKVYIGITSQKNINRRWKNGYGYSRHPYFNKAIEEFGWNNIKHEVLFENLSKEEADLLEQMYISLYDSNNKEHGYNMSFGGDTSLGRVLSNETKEKIGKANSGKNNGMYGRKGKDNPSSKKIICITTNEIFDYIKQASEKYNAGSSEISKCCKGKLKSAGKLLDGTPLQWMYYDEYENYIKQGENIDDLKLYDNKNYSKVICITTNEIFNSMKEAGEKYNVDPSSISRCCSRKLKSAGKLPDGTKLVWEYVV